MTSQTKAWGEVSLGEICEFKYGKSLPEGKRTGGDVPVYGSNGVVGWHNEAVSDGTTIIIGRKGSFGEVNFTPVSCWPIDTTYYIDSSATEVDLKWLAYLLPSLGLTQLNRAAAIPGLNREDAYRQRLLLPPLEEQKRIAYILDRAEALRAKRRKALAQLDELVQSIFIDMFGDPITNPKEWEIYSIGSLLTDVTNGLTRRRKESDEGTDIVLRLRDIRDGWIDFSDINRISLSDQESSRYKVSVDDLLFIRVNGNPDYVGRCALFEGFSEPVYFNDHIMRVKTDQSKVDGKLLVYMLNGTRGKREIALHRKTSAGQHTINQDGLGKIEIPLPPLKMQQEFAFRIASIEKLKSTYKASLAELDELFTSLQYRAFRGEI